MHPQYAEGALYQPLDPIPRYSRDCDKKAVKKDRYDGADIQKKSINSFIHGSVKYTV